MGFHHPSPEKCCIINGDAVLRTLPPISIPARTHLGLVPAQTLHAAALRTFIAIVDVHHKCACTRHVLPMCLVVPKLLPVPKGNLKAEAPLLQCRGT